MTAPRRSAPGTASAPVADPSCAAPAECLPGLAEALARLEARRGEVETARASLERGRADHLEYRRKLRDDVAAGGYTEHARREAAVKDRQVLDYVQMLERSVESSIEDVRCAQAEVNRIRSSAAYAAKLVELEAKKAARDAVEARRDDLRAKIDAKRTLVGAGTAPVAELRALYDETIVADLQLEAAEREVRAAQEACGVAGRELDRYPPPAERPGSASSSPFDPTSPSNPRNWAPVKYW